MSGGGCSVRAIWILTPNDTVAFSRYPSELFPSPSGLAPSDPIWGSPLPPLRQAVRGGGEEVACRVGGGGRRRRGRPEGLWGGADAAARRPRGRRRIRRAPEKVRSVFLLVLELAFCVVDV